MHTKPGIDDAGGYAKGFFFLFEIRHLESRGGGRTANSVVDDGLLGRRCWVRCRE
jgi:hypothetical protein